MADSSSTPSSNKNKRPRDDSPPPMPEKYKKIGISQNIWEKCSKGQYGVENALLEIHNKRINMYEERNKKDLEVIEEHQKKIEERNKKIEEEREKIVDVYRSIEASKYVS
jgi:hypothetical protein